MYFGLFFYPTSSDDFCFYVPMQYCKLALACVRNEGIYKRGDFTYWLFSDTSSSEGDLIWTQNGSDWPQMGQIRDFFRSDFSTFWRWRQNVLKSDLKKSRICPIWGQSDPFWGQIWCGRLCQRQLKLTGTTGCVCCNSLLQFMILSSLRLRIDPGREILWFHFGDISRHICHQSVMSI